MEDSIRSLKEGQENHMQEMGEIKNSLKDLGYIKEMLTAVIMKYDQMTAHVYGKQPQEPLRVSENQLKIPRSSLSCFWHQVCQDWFP